MGPARRRILKLQRGAKSSCEEGAVHICVVRPNDVKDLNRFIRNGKTFLLAENSAGKITHCR